MNNNNDAGTVFHSHDQFVRTTMSNARVARDFFVAHLPDDIQAIADLNHLELQPRSYINEIRQGSTVDLLFKSKLCGHNAYFYVLLEHQSTPDKFMPFRMLKYTCNVIDHYLKHHPKASLPLIYPMVIYHGERSYPFSTNINDLVDAPRDLVESYFLKPFQLIDVGKIDDRELKQHAWAGLMEFALKHIFAVDILPHLQEVSDLMYSIDRAGGTEYIMIVVQYMLSRGQVKDRECLRDVVKKTLPETGDKIMGYLEQLRLEGWQEERQEGRQEEKLEFIKNLLAEKVEVSVIAKTSGIPMSKILELQTHQTKTDDVTK